ncbi:MAG: ABC transporter permease [Azospirillaceae bacterium]
MHRRFLPWLLVAPAGLVILVILVLPILDTARGTLDAAAGHGQAYLDFFDRGLNRGILWRTTKLALIVTAIAVVLGLPTAFYIARSPQARRSMLIVAAVFPLLTGTVVRSFAWIVILGRNGLLNDVLLWAGVIGEPIGLLYTETAIVLGLAYLFTPLMILSLVGVLENIDHDLMDAARSLGATPAATFRQVTLPLAVPGLIVGSVLVFTGSFTAYTTPVLLGGQRNTVLATLLYREAMVEFDWPAASTIAVIMMIVTVAIVLTMGWLARRMNPAVE